jgi:uncharacterized protein YdhG (YjbR/CyaY superfamily)
MPTSRPPEPKAIDAYIARAPADFRPALQRIRATIRAAAPEADEIISYGLPAFRQGRILVYYGAFADHLSLFVASPAVRRKFAEELAPFHGGKGTVRFTPDHPLPSTLVRRIVKARLAETARPKRA